MDYVGADTGELRTASQAVHAAVAVARSDALPPTGGDESMLGSHELASALGSFLEGWGVGIEAMVGTSGELALSLEQMAEALIDINAGAEESQ